MRYPISLREAREAGIPRKQLRSREWQRVAVGLYAPASMPADANLRLRAAVKRLPRGAVFSDRTAGWLLGLDLPPCDPIEAIVTPGGGVWTRSGVRVRRAPVPPRDIVSVGGFRATSPLRTVTDLAARLPRVEAVIATDAALNRRLVNLESLDNWARAAAGRKGVRQLRWTLSMADAGAESPLETRLRLLLVEAHLPRPQTQIDLHDAAGRFLGRADLYFPNARLVIEFDGGVHRDRLVEDDRRQNRILGAGFAMLRFTGPDVLGAPAKVVQAVRDALRRGAPFAESVQMAGPGLSNGSISVQMAGRRPGDGAKSVQMARAGSEGEVA
ncbi:MAG TPA: DUF559 domain-containing protein [Solirubrobacterales bacterium]|nr:DUF559 domain-containing protein [Solirubrobacterales bacterium]